ncbi:chaperonin 10-like protein [Leptodontidium sp. MPI-SDFR-AT-0119]|nr:chaperonin 10-like protein [Leptodontidium sp. MPI-SDFR-AT-0119]
MALPETMRAVVMNSNFNVAVEDRPTPKLQHSMDAIIRVTLSGLCGSDLHYYRGHLPYTPGFVMGHEIVGAIAQKGDDVKNFEIGDMVVVPFFTSCQNCFFCLRGQASRCLHGQSIGNSGFAIAIDGGQAEYVRVPLAGTTLMPVPTGIPQTMLALMADIFPTGYFAASRFLKNLPPNDKKSTVAVAVGCGPVGACAITAALTMCDTVYAIDSVPERLVEAEKLGARPILISDDPISKIMAATDGRGADVVMELVGRVDALHLAIDLVRPFGFVSSIGVYTEVFTVPASQLYGKNLTLAFGRCPVRSIFQDALDILIQEQEKLEFLCGQIMDLEQAPEAYNIFEKRKVHKIIFTVGGGNRVNGV